jgi:hypothetical protein
MILSIDISITSYSSFNLRILSCQRVDQRQPVAAVDSTLNLNRWIQWHVHRFIRAKISMAKGQELAHTLRILGCSQLTAKAIRHIPEITSTRTVSKA